MSLTLTLIGVMSGPGSARRWSRTPTLAMAPAAAAESASGAARVPSAAAGCRSTAADRAAATSRPPRGRAESAALEPALARGSPAGGMSGCRRRRRCCQVRLGDGRRQSSWSGVSWWWEEVDFRSQTRTGRS